ncbi:hypothetical protein BASA60_003918 [Batrachochytrium salamandrivorans]|nr:hypothetical protein BASA60_003918 [Batrachochytrium salamandrivorans]
MFDSLLWVLYHFVTHYAGQTTQGDKNGVDQASGSDPNPKKVPSLPPRPDSTRQTRPLPKIPTSDQSGASSSADPQPEKDCTDEHGIRRVSKSCPQQPSPPGSQPSTLHVLPKPGEMTLPVYLGKSEAKPYLRDQKTDQYDAFIASEIKYAKLEYPNKKKLSEGDFGKERPDIVDARDIIKKIVEAMIHLKQYGILHLDVQAGNVMYNPKTRKIKLLDFGVSAVLPGWEGGKSLPLKSPDLSSTSPGYKAGDDEL